MFRAGSFHMCRNRGVLDVPCWVLPAGCFTEDAVRSAFVEAAHDDAGKLPFRSFYAVLDALGHQVRFVAELEGRERPSS
eukprot:895155-Pelagomonas_calceolata.AAC.1